MKPVSKKAAQREARLGAVECGLLFVLGFLAANGAGLLLRLLGAG